MALRNRFGLNSQKVTFGNMFQLVPLGYHEVAPGDTIRGRITTDIHSSPLVRNINTRTYVDTYVFYCPYRILWDEWTEFITQNGSAPPSAVPTLANTFTQNFEPRLTWGASTAAPATANTVWLRRMYGLVYEKFFKENPQEDYDPASFDATTSIQNVWLRPTTWEKSEPMKQTASETIDTSGATVTVDEVRRAFAQDQWNKMREFYGDRYTDYMRQIGVSVPWTLLDEPEVISMQHHDLPFRMVTDNNTNTGDTPGLSAGYYKSKVINDLKRTFAPEHGLIGAYATIRADCIFTEPACSPVLAKTALQDYWSPEFDSEKEYAYSTLTMGETPVNFTTELRPKWDDYRMSVNENYKGTFTSSDNMGMYVSGDAKNNQLTIADVLSNFATTGRFSDANCFQFTGEHRLERRSPIPRRGQSKPIH